MLIAYVSDEHYAALPDVALEFDPGDQIPIILRSSPRGAVYADLPSGTYRVTLAKPGYTAKTITVTVSPGAPPHQFRLLSDTLYGYAWPKWVQSGAAAEFRVHSPEPYHLTLWRYGLSRQLVRPLGWFDEHGPRANTQILPDTDFTQTGTDWNRHGFNPAAFRVTAPDRSGLYFFHAETPSGQFLSFPWVVAPAAPTARIAVIASTNTWNAYNNFGGRSNYINADRLPPSPTVNARQDLGRYTGGPGAVWAPPNDAYQPLSFDRPEPFNHIPKDVQWTDPIRGRQACHLAETEWRLLAWLEHEGFDHDLWSDHQLHTGQLDPSAYAVVVLSTHPEYWSRDAYLRLKHWVFGRGGHLLYLGGNGIDCEVDFPDPATMRCNTWYPVPVGRPFTDPATGQTYDCRFHQKVESPAQLLGVVFTEPGIATAAPYRALDASHWIFQGTNLKTGDLFGAASLHERCPGGASGHETDKRTPNSPPSITVLARGTNPNNGGAELTYFQTPSAGSVFSTGSITWPASLPVDPACSRITRNVLQRMLSTSS